MYSPGEAGLPPTCPRNRKIQVLRGSVATYLEMAEGCRSPAPYGRIGIPQESSQPVGCLGISQPIQRLGDPPPKLRIRILQLRQQGLGQSSVLEAPQRFDNHHPDVLVGVVQHLHQRSNGPGIAPRPQETCGCGAHLRARVLEGADEASDGAVVSQVRERV